MNTRYALDPRTIVLCNALRHAHSALTFGVSDEQRAEIAKTIELALAPYVTDAAPTQPVLP